MTNRSRNWTQLGFAFAIVWSTVVAYLIGCNNGWYHGWKECWEARDRWDEATRNNPPYDWTPKTRQ